MTSDIHAPVPLTEMIEGTLHMHFPGASVTRRVTLAEALNVQQMISDKRSSDALDWFHLGWMQFDSSKVLACEFDADEDCGWGLTPEDRATLKRTHHPHGILRTLRNLWKDKGERQPSFSVLALRFLSDAALDGVSMDEFALIAERIEGEEGTKSLQALLDHLEAAGSSRTEVTDPSDDGTGSGDRSGNVDAGPSGTKREGEPDSER